MSLYGTICHLCSLRSNSCHLCSLRSLKRRTDRLHRAPLPPQPLQQPHRSPRCPSRCPSWRSHPSICPSLRRPSLRRFRFPALAPSRNPPRPLLHPPVLPRPLLQRCSSLPPPSQLFCKEQLPLVKYLLAGDVQAANEKLNVVEMLYKLESIAFGMHCLDDRILQVYCS